MSSYVQDLLDRYGSKGILVDANLLLLDLVGSYDLRLVGDGRFNKLSKYVSEDYKLLTRLKRVFRVAVTTPHVLTEVSNLAGDLPEAVRLRCFDHFSTLVTGLQELNLAAIDVVQRPEFRYLGLTDSALAQVSHQFLVVTDDARMVAHLNRAGLEALNFNYLREHLFR